MAGRLLFCGLLAQLGLLHAAAAVDACSPSGNLHFVCGAQHPEDLAHIPGTPWLIASGFSDGARSCGSGLTRQTG